MKINKELLEKNIIKETVQLHPFYYCLVKKQSESGLLINERMLFLQESDFSIFYSKNIPSAPYSKSAELPTGKIKLRVSEIQASLVQNMKCILIKYQKKKIEWKFYFDNEKLAKKWLKCMQALQQKVFRLSMDRKTLISTKSTSSILSIGDDLGFGKTLNKSASFIEKNDVNWKKVLQLEKIEQSQF